MILIGGVDPSLANENLIGGIEGSPDPWAQGLGVFGLTSLQWKNFYQSNSGPYISPDVVQEHYITYR